MKNKIKNLLLWTQKYTKTDMVYVAKGSFWLLIGKIGIILISFATMAAFANWLPIKIYGTYQFIISITGLAALAGLPGIKTALVRSIAKRKEGSLIVAFKTKFIWSLAGSIGLLALAGWYFINKNLLLAGAFLVPALFLPLKSSFGVFASFWEGRKRFDVRTRLGLSADLGTATALILTLFITNKIWLILTAFFGSTAIFYAIGFLYTQKKIQNKEIDKNLISFGKNLTAISVISTVAQYMDKIILWKLLGPVQVAIYSFALKPVEKIKGFAPIQKLILPKLVEREIDGEERKRAVFNKFLLMFTLTIPSAIIAILAAPFIYRIIFPRYTDSIIFFRALSLLIITIPFGILGTALIAEIRTKHLYIINIIVPLFKISLFFVLSPFYGIWGIVATLLLSEFLRDALSLYFFWKI